MSKIKPKAKRLTLQQAITMTSKPAMRSGELICVQVDKRFGNLYQGMIDLAGDSFNAGEMRSIFRPSTNIADTQFTQPETENYLRELYSEEGRIESLEDFSDEALALYYRYQAGHVTPSGLACDAGDPAQFERDYMEAIAQLPLTRETVEAVRKTVLLMHKKYKLSATQGEQRSAQQAGFRGKQQIENQERHEQWRTWQETKAKESPQFAGQSKQEQAARLRSKYTIQETVPTIAKRLNPLPNRK